MSEVHFEIVEDVGQRVHIASNLQGFNISKLRLSSNVVLWDDVSLDEIIFEYNSGVQRYCAIVSTKFHVALINLNCNESVVIVHRQHCNLGVVDFLHHKYGVPKLGMTFRTIYAFQRPSYSMRTYDRYDCHECSSKASTMFEPETVRIMPRLVARLLRIEFKTNKKQSEMWLTYMYEEPTTQGLRLKFNKEQRYNDVWVSIGTGKKKNSQVRSRIVRELSLFDLIFFVDIIDGQLHGDFHEVKKWLKWVAIDG
jgi:hypothetical protein